MLTDRLCIAARAPPQVIFLTSLGRKGVRGPPHNGACMLKFYGPSSFRAAYEAINLLNQKVVLPTCQVRAALAGVAAYTCSATGPVML